MNIVNVKHTAIYLRISDEKKEAGKRVESEETLRNHKETLVNFANKNNYTYEIFQEVLSGGISDIEDRPQLHSLLQRIEEFDAILVVELSRLSRNGKISELVLEYCQDYRKLIITPESAYDLNNEMDALMFRLGSAISEHERKIIGKRIKNNKLQMTKLGLNASGSVPLGYKRNPSTKKLEIDEDKAEIVRYAFKLCQDGYGASKISKALNDLNHRTARGNRFTTRAVKEMLKVETYKGFMVYHNYTKTKRKGKMIREVVDTIVIENAHPPIIKPEIFDSVQVDRKKRAERYSGGKERPNNKVAPSIIKDLVYCKLCGKKMRISYENNKGYHLVRKCVEELAQTGDTCENSGFLSSNIEITVVQKIFERKEELQEIVDKLSNGKVDSLTEDWISLKKSIEKQIVTLNEEMKGLLRLELKYEMQGMSEIQEEFIREEKQANLNKVEKLKSKLNELEAKLKQPSIEDEIDKYEKQIKSIDSILDYDIKNKEYAEKINEGLKNIIKKIYYKRIIPNDIKKLGSKNPKRRDYPATIDIEYFD